MEIKILKKSTKNLLKSTKNLLKSTKNLLKSLGAIHKLGYEGFHKLPRGPSQIFREAI